MNFLDFLKKDVPLNQMSALTLAYVGDAVYELYVRTKALEYSQNSHQLNLIGVQAVNNVSQATLLEKIEGELNEMEKGVVRRGRNAKGIVPKNAKIQDYRKATALEALVGYLYLAGEDERLSWILAQIEEFMGDENESGR